MLPIRRSARTPAPSSSLPAPVTQSNHRHHHRNNTNNTTTGRSNRSGDKKTTFEPEQVQSALKVHWSRFKKRLGAGSALSESIVEVTDGGTGTSESALRRYPESQAGGNQNEGQEENEEVDEVVVDNNFWIDSMGSKSITQPSERGAITPEKSGASGTHATGMTDHDSLHEKEGIWRLIHLLHACWWRFKSAFKHFFFLSFYDPVAEAHYRKETYFQSKSLALWGACFIVLNWVLVCVLANREDEIYWDKIFYYVIAPVFSAPLPFMVIFDWPRKFPVFYQFYMTFALWCWGEYNLLMLSFCGYYDPARKILSCPTKDFVSIFYYTTGFPVIALFALGQNRLSAAISGLFTATALGLVIRHKQSWIRNTLNFVCYVGFLVWLHYQKETAERRLHTIRDRLKVQYKATQKAQVSESKAADSKKRFSSYIFHEVRVPLNTALLAVQNMDAAGIFKKDDIEFTALEGSLNMMSKVLNDVLDFNRMDSGRFESVAKPYPFHKVVQGMLVPLKLAAAARGLDLIIELDPQIDIIARTALYQAKGETDEWIKQVMDQGEDEESGSVVGDEHRLRQIVTNLTSNACKFTPTGGKIYVRTRLLRPGAGPDDPDQVGPQVMTRSPSSQKTPQTERAREKGEGDGDDKDKEPHPTGSGRLSARQLHLHNLTSGGVPVQDRIVIRIEVEDTGVGIKKKDMVDNRLFSPYVQTDIGRFQGGKGTGLGLALSKNIVRLSGGRLGVKSQRGHGSIFWVELPVGVGPKVLEKQEVEEKGKEDMVTQTFSVDPDTAEAFRAPRSEGATPSTTLTDSPHESTFPTLRAAPPSAATTHAMQQLMEHSGQIELLRMPEYVSSNTLMQGDYSTGSMNGSTHFAQSALQMSPLTHIPQRLPLPAAQSYTSSGTAGSRYTEGTTPLTPPPCSPLSAATTPPSAETIGPTKAGKPGPISLPRPDFTSVPDVPTTEPPVSGPEALAALPTSDPGPQAAIPHSPPPTFDPPLNVLVVDDDGLTRKLMSRMLTRIGCTVELAENGQMALEMTLQVKNPFNFGPLQPSQQGKRPQTPYMTENEPKYDVIFLDNQMPIMSGVEMVKRLRGLNRKDFVVGVTGNALKEDQSEYLDAGVDAVLTKPVKEASLRTYLHMANERRKTLEQNHKDETTANHSQPP